MDTSVYRQKETVKKIVCHYLREKYERGEREKLEKMREREERRKKKQLAKLMEREDVDLNSKVMEEQNKLLKAQKKLQAIRLIEELFKRIEVCNCYLKITNFSLCVTDYINAQCVMETIFQMWAFYS